MGKVLDELLDRPIAFHRAFANVGGSVAAGLFMSQAYYWSKRTTEPGGWFYKTGVEWTQETMLTRSEQENARARWKQLGVLEEHKHGTPPVLHYRVDRPKLLDLVEALLHEVTNQFAEINKLNGGNQPINLPNPANLYNTETTAETTAETTVDQPTYAYVREGEVLPPGTPIPNSTELLDTDILTSTPNTAIMPIPTQATDLAGPDFVQYGKKPPTPKGLSMPPDRAVVTDAALAWARAKGWRGDMATLQEAVDTCLDFFRGKGERKGDWPAVFRNWIRRNIDEGKDLPTRINAQLELQNGQRGTAPDRAGTGMGAARYGYNAAGKPTNRATQLRSTAEVLAERQRARNLAEQAGTDFVSQHDDDRSSD